MQAQGQKTPKQLVESYMAEMNNYDPDLQEMGAKYLSELVLSGKINLIEDPDLARKITQNFLKQVDSQNFMVHSCAIRFLAEMVPKLPKNQLLHIFHETVSAIAKTDTPQERRELFSTAAGTMIHLAPDDFGHALSDLFVQSINHLTNSKTKNPEVEMLLLNVITQFSRKWPNVAGSRQVKFDRKNFIHYLLKNIESSNKQMLIRKSDGALGKLCLIFERENFQFCFNEKQIGLLPFIRKNCNYEDEESGKNLRNGMTSLAHIVKGNNLEMKPWAKEIALLCLEIIHENKAKDIFMEIVTEIVEHSLSCLTYILKAYSSELQDLLADGCFKLYEFLQQMLEFDLEGTMSFFEADIEEQQDNYDDDEDYADDSTCWKVRAASLSYVTVLMHKHKGFRENKAKSQEFISLMGSKLLEQNESVSKNAFESFNDIVQLISTPRSNTNKMEEQIGLRRVKSSEGDFAINIASQISDKIYLLSKNKKTKEEIKTQSSKTLLYIIELLSETIRENEEFNIKLLELVLFMIGKVNSDSCINLLRALKSLMTESLPFQKVEQLIHVYLKHVKDKNMKVAATSFSGLRALEKVYGESLVRQGKFQPILDVILQKMKENDADKMVKVSVIKCLGPIFKNMFSILNEKDQNMILSSVQDKIKVEIDKSIILQQLSQLSNSFPMKKSQQLYFKDLLDLASENLGSVNFELNYNSIESCDRLINIQRASLSVSTVQSILQRCKPIFFDHKLPKFLQVLIETHPKSLINYTEVIVKTADSFYITKLIEKKITNSKTCLQILRGVGKSQNAKKISLILSKLDVNEQYLIQNSNESQWGLICLGSLGYIGNVKTVDYLLPLLENSKSDQIKFQAARAIGNISSRNPQLLEKLIKILQTKEDGYLFIFAIKEMLHYSHKEFAELPNLISFLFQKGEQNMRETNQYVISESIGQISRISVSQMKKILDSVNQMNEARKCIVANSLRYALEGKAPENDFVSEDTQFYIGQIMNLTLDNSLNVKYGAMKSLNSISNSYSMVIQQKTNEKFVVQLLDSILIKPENIIIVDYGVNKEKKDLGKPLRIQAFNFLKSTLDIRALENKYEEIVSKCIDKMNEETSNDLILKRVSIIKKICQKDFSLFIPYLNEFESKLGTEQGVLKSHQVKAATDDERNQGYLKSLLKEVLEIQAAADRQGNQKVKAFVNNIKRSERLNGYIDNLQ